MEIADAEFFSCPTKQIGATVDLQKGWIVIRHDHLSGKAERRKLYGRWVAIKSDQRTIYRIIRFSPTVPRDGIVIDWGGWIDLQPDADDLGKSLNLKISTVKWHQAIRIPFVHVDNAVRISAYLGGLSTLLGIASIILAFK
ncbi:hypothetical protein [Novosphingobium sp. PASSN1]|uniref:hypothetical protein n=1 Tax=Novosphingobium sp. PASSN1 TaxID=2015561 RepID=UPI0025F194E9|nr:hypothetical protein [Novosphingobium sp. PASSN1]